MVCWKDVQLFITGDFASAGNYDFDKTITSQESWASLGLQKKITSWKKLTQLLKLLLSLKNHEYIGFSTQTSFTTFTTDYAFVLVQAPVTVGSTWRNFLPSKYLLPLPSGRFLAVGWLQRQGLNFYTTYQWGFWCTAHSSHLSRHCLGLVANLLPWQFYSLPFLRTSIWFEQVSQ